MPQRPRNDPGQYDDLSGEWWKPNGRFAALHWLAETRATLVPPPKQSGALLLDLACGGGLLAPLVEGYLHVGVDITQSALVVARDHGVTVTRADLSRLPFPDRCADVVVAGEIFEHLTDLEGAVTEIARVMKPGATLVFDTIADTWWARFSLVTVGERLPGGPPPGIHDPTLFVAPRRLRELCRRHGLDVRLSGLRPSAWDYVRFLRGRATPVRMLPTRSLAAVYCGTGRKTAHE